MYVQRTDLVQTAAGAAALEAFVGRCYEASSRQPGFLRAMLGRSLAGPAYLSLTFWASEAAARAWFAGDAAVRLRAQAQQDALVALTRPSEGYETVFEAAGTAQAIGHLGLAERTVDDPARQAAAFEETARTVSELRRLYGAGFVSNMLVRNVGGGGRYMAILLYTSHAAAAAIDSAAEIGQYRRAHRFGAYTGPATLSEYDPVLLVTAQAAAEPVPPAH